MTESLINEWLEDCADVSPSKLHTFATTLLQNNEIVRALYVLLEERSKYSQVMHCQLDIEYILIENCNKECLIGTSYIRIQYILFSVN